MVLQWARSTFVALSVSGHLHATSTTIRKHPALAAPSASKSVGAGSSILQITAEVSTVIDRLPAIIASGH